MVRLDERLFTLSTQGSQAMNSKLPACVVLALLTFVLRISLLAQATTVNSPCEAGLVKPTSDPLAYRLRGERCEGVYVREVAGTGGFSVVAFVAEGGQPAIARWPAIATV
jgi:hypothetical protein